MQRKNTCEIPQQSRLAAMGSLANWGKWEKLGKCGRKREMRQKGGGNKLKLDGLHQQRNRGSGGKATTGGCEGESS